MNAFRQTSLFDRAALECLAAGHHTATHHVARACGFDRKNGDRATSRARNLLRRLARWGLVEGVRPIGGGNIYWWKITDAGRSALQPEQLR